jgi:hypothetical protein
MVSFTDLLEKSTQAGQIALRLPSNSRVSISHLSRPRKVAPQMTAKTPLKGFKPVRSLNPSPESQFRKVQEKALKSFLRSYLCPN